MQFIQVAIQKRVISTALAARDFTLPWPMRVINALPWLNRLPALMIGRGLRCERLVHRVPASVAALPRAVE